MNSQKYLTELFELLSIPTISAQPKHVPDMERACKWLRAKFEDLKFTADILPTNGHPVVYAEYLKVKDAPTVLVYGHYDVQSPDPLAEWSSEPFKPEIRSGNIYGRGTADDKGQLYTWIAAIEELLQKKGNLPVNMKFLLEGEEEIGSENLDAFIADNRPLLKADICVISDSHCLSETMPVICYGLRGLIYIEVHVTTLPKDVHSGIYGGNVLNPATVLSQMIAKLKDENHKILIPGFYNNVRKLSDSERKELKRYPFTEKEVIAESGAKVVAGEKEFTVQERAGARPTLDVNGIWGGYLEEGPKTIIPGSAHAKISMRLVPNQSSAEIFEKVSNYLKEITPHGVEVEIVSLSGGEPILMDTSSRYYKAAEKAYTKIFGTKPIYELSGGSIPVTATLKNGLAMDSVLMGYGLPDDGLHSPNEKLSVAMFEKGIQTNIKFLENL